MDYILESDNMLEKIDIDCSNIKGDKEISKEDLIFQPRNGEKVHNIVFKKTNNKGQDYFVFEYLKGKPVMLWNIDDYDMVREQINIRDYPIVVCHKYKYSFEEEKTDYFQVATNERFPKNNR